MCTTICIDIHAELFAQLIGRYSNLPPSTVVSVRETTSSKILGTYSTDNTVFEHTLYFLTILHITSLEAVPKLATISAQDTEERKLGRPH